MWHEWRHPDRPWVGTAVPCTEADKTFFSAATTVSIGNGQTAKFWTCSWTGSGTLKLSFPALFKHSRRKNRTVAAALSDDTWIRDLAHGNTTAFITEVVALARLIRSLQPIITQGATDLIKWNLEASGNYSASSAYKAQFQGCCSSNFRELIWQAWGPVKLKFFSWLLHLNRLWCNDRLQRRGWENPYFCQLCLRSLESSEHLFWQCPFSTQVWCSLASWTGCEAILRGLEPQLHSSTDRITRVVEDTAPASRKGINPSSCWLPGRYGLREIDALSTRRLG